MPDPHDTLSILAEVSVALAGFSGIVVAFGRRTPKPLSRMEIRRLFNLFTLSGTALIFSLFGISLLYIEAIDQHLLWSWGSASICLLMGVWLARDMVKVYRFDAHEKKEINLVVITFFNSLAVGTLVLQLFNWLSMKQAWPLLFALVVIIGGAFQQFILLVYMELREQAGQATSAN